MAATAVAQPLLPDAFIGQFRGTVAGEDTEADGAFTVAIGRDGSGFTVAWPPRFVARFRPSGRPHVFRGDGEQDLLEGNPVHWARIEDEVLTVYTAQIDQTGGYRVDVFEYSPSETGLDLVLRRIRSGADARVSRGKLERYGN